MSDIVIYEDGDVALNATVEDETIWLSQKQMAELFGKSVRTINEHISNVFKEGELEKESTIRNFRIVQIEGKREVARVDCKAFRKEGILEVIHFYFENSAINIEIFS